MAAISPLELTRALMPVLLTLTSGLALSIARMRLIVRCCPSTERPNQPRLDVTMRKSGERDCQKVRTTLP